MIPFLCFGISCFVFSVDVTLLLLHAVIREARFYGFPSEEKQVNQLLKYKFKKNTRVISTYIKQVLSIVSQLYCLDMVIGATQDWFGVIHYLDKL